MPYQRKFNFRPNCVLLPSSFLFPPHSSNKTIISTVTEFLFTYSHTYYELALFYLTEKNFPDFSAIYHHLQVKLEGTVHMPILLCSSNRNTGFYSKYRCMCHLWSSQCWPKNDAKGTQCFKCCITSSTSCQLVLMSSVLCFPTWHCPKVML